MGQCSLRKQNRSTTEGQIKNVLPITSLQEMVSKLWLVFQNTTLSVSQQKYSTKRVPKIYQLCDNHSSGYLSDKIKMCTLDDTFYLYGVIHRLKNTHPAVASVVVGDQTLDHFIHNCRTVTNEHFNLHTIPFYVDFILVSSLGIPNPTCKWFVVVNYNHLLTFSHHFHYYIFLNILLFQYPIWNMNT